MSERFSSCLLLSLLRSAVSDAKSIFLTTTFLLVFPLKIRSELHLKAKLCIPFGVAKPSCSGLLSQKLHHVWHCQHRSPVQWWENWRETWSFPFPYFRCKDNKFCRFLHFERLLITLRCVCACPHFPCEQCAWCWAFLFLWLAVCGRSSDSSGRTHTSSFLCPPRGRAESNTFFPNTL